MNHQCRTVSTIVLWTAITVPLLPIPAFAEKPRSETIQAWDRYLAWADAKNQREASDPNGFLFEDFLASQERSSIQQRVLAGQVVIRRTLNVVPFGTDFSVPNGEIHHWWGGILVPGIKLPELLVFLKDYDHHARRFADVEQSRLCQNRATRSNSSFA